MSYDDDQIEFPLPGDKPEKRESARHLPKYFRTDKNRKFLQSTLDQIMQPGVAEKVNSFVGRKTAKAFTSDDNYLGDISADRENYQLEPVSIIKDRLGNVEYLKDYNDFINQIGNFNGVNNNHGRNTKEEYYAWDPHIDWDKFSNFREYYWLPNGPQTVVVPGEQKEITSTYTVKLQEALGDYSYVFTPDGLTPNPSLKLYRGVKYRFEIDTPGLPLTFRTSRTLEDEFLLKTEVSQQAVENGVIELELGPDTPNEIFYVADNNINLGGIIKVANQSEATFIDVENEILNKKFYTARDGWNFTNGLKIRFEGEVIPEKYSNTEWYVEGVGDKIKLVSDIDVEVSFPVGIDLDVPFDGEEGFDRLPYSTATGYPRDKDYITINRASNDGNFWSRYNRWFHREVIIQAAEINGTEVDIDQTARANRPIIEFEAGLKLYNFGTRNKDVIDLMDDFTTDAFSTVEGSLGYNIDGVQLTEGMRVLFLNDSDPLVKSRIFEVKFINFAGSGTSGQITLVETEDSIPLPGENVLVTQGLTYSGKIWYYDGTDWNLTQEKIGTNQPPVFDVFDTNDISFSNAAAYPATSFRGTKIFSFKQGTGTNDNVLGFPLSYKSIENVGDIVFDFDYNIDNFQYQINDTVFETKINSGFLRKYTTDTQFEVVGIYTKADRKSEQKVVLQYINDGTKVNFPINCFDKSGLLYDLLVDVYVNNNIQYVNTDYELVKTNDNILNVRFLSNIPENASIIIKCSSKEPKNKNGYYEIADNLEKNPANDDILTFTLGEVSDHVSSIVGNTPTFSGVFPGASNLRDIANLSKFGKKFIKHSSPLNLAMYSLLDKNSNLIKSLRFARKEYSKFRRTFFETAESLGFDGPVKQHVDAILTEITKDKVNTMPFYFSDMVAYGSAITTRITIEDIDSQFFALNTPFTLSTLSRRAVTVYLNGVQLIHERDYTFNSEGFLQLTVEKAFGDVLEINEYETTNGTYIPPTPSKLGLYPTWEPELYVDDTYGIKPNMIRGHDGSTVRAFNDYRDDLLLELEKRIYNNIKIKYDNTCHDINTYLPGLFRDTAFTREEVYKPMTTDFIQWLSLVDQDYTEHSYFDRQNTFTFNYSGMKDKEGKALPGWWRGIYKHYFDTDRPHTNPWEMLGFTVKPIWWEEVYGPAPYTNTNSLLWEDLEAGIIRKPGEGFKIDKSYARPGLTKFIPVNSDGQLLGPSDCNVPNRFSSTSISEDFKFGDNSPVESAWTSSPEYPFALITSWAINSPASLLATGFDRSRQVKNVLGHIVYQPNMEYIKLKDLVFPNTAKDTTNIYTSGLVNYVAGFIASNLDNEYDLYKSNLRSIKNNLAFKIGGFTDKSKFKLILDSRTPTNEGNVFVPEENYQIVFNTSSPIRNINYSGVIVELTASGFVVRGYDKESPAFNYYSSLSSTNDLNVNVGGVSEPFSKWNPEQTFAKGTIVQNDNNYYRVKSTFTSDNTFKTESLEPLPSLPVTGGINAVFKSRFNTFKVETLPYGSVLNTVQDVIDFLLGYQKWLETQGFRFEYYDGTEKIISDFKNSAREFMFWNSQNWSKGAVISLSPAADQVYFESNYEIVDNVFDSFYGYSLIKSDGNKLFEDFIKVSRQEENVFKLEPKNTADGVYAIKIPVVQKEHVVIIDNTSVFGDIIYQPATGYRQERLKVFGYRTADWNGGLDIPGFLYSEIKIKEWEQWKDYSVGDIVNYKEFYYTAKNKIPGAEYFVYSDWTRLEDIPESGLITNFEYKTNQFADFYDLDTDNFDIDQQKLAQHLIGYQKRKYLENIINDEVSQYKFYQGMIQEKGSKNSLDKLFDVLSAADKESLDFYEEWAVKQGQYGASEGYEELEFRLDEKKLRINPQPIELTNVDTETTDLIYRIKDFEVFRKPKNYSNNAFPVLNEYQQFTRSPGYVFGGDVKHSLAEYYDILNLSVNDVDNLDYIWIGSKNNSWDVLQQNIVAANVTRIETTPTKVVESDAPYQLKFTLDKGSVDIKEGDIIGIRDVVSVNDIADDSSDYPINKQDKQIFSGFFKVVLKELNVLYVDSQEEQELISSCIGLVTDFSSVRAANYKEANEIAQRSLIRSGNKLWVDNVDQNWQVLQNEQSFGLLQQVPAEEAGENNNFASSIAIDGKNTTLAIASPTAGLDGKVFVYTRGGNNQNWQFSSILETTAAIGDLAKGFGKSMAFSLDGKYLIIGSPDASNIVSRYKGEYQESADYQNGEIVKYLDQLWEVVVDIRGADPAGEFGSFGSVAEVLDKNSILNNEVAFNNIVTGNYPFTDVETDHVLIRAFTDQYESTREGDVVYFDWYANTTLNQFQTPDVARAPFDGAIPVLSESFIESGLTIQKKIDVILYVNSITNIPDLLQQVETQGAFGYVSYVYEDEGRATIYIQETSGSWPSSGSLFFESGEFVGEYVREAPIETIDTSEDLGGYWWFNTPSSYNVDSVNSDQGRALAVNNVVPQGQPDSGAAGGNIFDLNNNVTNIGDNAINSYFRTLVYQGTPGPGGNLDIIPSDLFVVRGPKDLTDQLTPGDEVGLTFFRFPNNDTGQYTDITVTGVTYEQVNKKHSLVDVWDGYIDFDLDEEDPNTFLPLEPKVGQFVRDSGTNATARVEFFQKFNNSRARAYVSQVSGQWTFINNVSTLIMLGIPTDPNPIYQSNQPIGNIRATSLGSTSLNIGGLCVFRLDAEIEDLPVQDTVVGAEYIIYKDFTILGLPTLPNIPAANNLDYRQIFKIAVDPNEGVSNGISNLGYFSVYVKENVSSFTPVNSFIIPDQIDGLRVGSNIKIAKRNDLYKAFIGASGNGTNNNPGRIYVINNGIDDEGISYNWELSKDKRYQGVFSQTRDYFVDDIVYYEGKFYKALTNIAGDGSIFIPLEWELVTNDQIRSIDYLGYLPNDTGNYVENEDYKGFFSLDSNYTVGEIVQYANGDFYKALRSIPTNYLGFVDNNGVIEVPEGDWELIDFTPGGDSNTSLDQNNLIQFGKEFDVSDNAEVLITTAEYNTGVTKVAIYRNVNDNYQKTQELISPLVNDSNIDFARSISISQDGKMIAVGAPGADDSTLGEDIGYVFVYEQINGSYILTQTLESANPIKGEGYGRKIEFDGNTLYVSAFNASSDDITTFDNNGTIFDNDFTYFRNEIANNGVVYVYDRINTSLVFGQTLDYHTYIDRSVAESDYFGRNIAARKNHLYVALPDYLNQDGKVGTLLDYRKNDNTKIWNVVRDFTPPADLSKIKKIMLYDLNKNQIIQQLDYIDPVQGKIAGPADEEIRYKTAVDPAVYTNGTSNVVVQETNSWGSENVGSVWWDLTNAKFVNVYQGNLIYRSNNFNQLAPGGSIDVYEWVESKYTPAQWDELSGSNRGESLGISGTSKYGQNGYSLRRVYDNISKTFNNYYYYWVKNKITIPNIDTRSISVDTVANLIEDPSGQGYKFISIFDSNTFALHNCNSLIKDTDTVLNIQYWTYANELSNIHNQYQIITEGLGSSVPYADITRKLTDSLVGFDEQSRPVPDYNLSPKDKYGILNTPRQSMFVNRTEALKQVIERVNSVCKQTLIVDEKNISNLLVSDPAPSIITGLYDEVVDTYTDLTFVGVIRAETAILTPVVIDGKIDRVTIDNPGRGYRVPPTYKIKGQGSDAELVFTIDNLGQINSVTVKNQGANYNSDTTIEVRPFTALVRADEQINGKWSIHEKSGNSWLRIGSQSYNVGLYWDYIDWYADGYDEYTEIDFVIDLSYSLQGLNDNLGDVIKILNVGGEGWLLLEKIDEQDTTDYTANYKTIGKQNGTIKFKETLYNYNSGSIGFDNQSFDTQFFDLQPIAETRIILNELKDNIFVNDLEDEYNKLFFVCLRYAFSEQGYIDWAFKTSFVKAQHNVGELSQKPTFKNDSLASYEDYINEVKPYKSKVREYISNYTKIDNTSTVVTDFDSPPRFNAQSQRITPNDVKVVDGVLFGLGITDIQDQNWLENVSYKVTSINISNPGKGYLSAPQIIIDGNATAQASLGPNGVISNVVVTNPGSGYLSKPDITINGSLSDDGEPAILDAVIGDTNIRSMHTIVKFDRTSGNFFITQLSEQETFAGTGSRTDFDLKWPMDMRTNTIEVLVNGELVLNSNYDFDNYLDPTNTGYDKYYGRVSFIDPPLNNTVIQVNYQKSIKLLDAQDRINLFYNPTDGQIGKDISQLMDGVDYGGVQVKSFDFGGPTGWDNDSWYSGNWDLFDETYDDEIFTTDGSTLVFNLTKPLEDGVTYNVYVNGIRVDDNDYDGTTSVTNPYAIMEPVTGDGVTDVFTFENEVEYRRIINEIDSSGEDNPPPVTITLRRATSDGSIKINEESYDTALTGGDLAYTTARGISAEDITVDGDGFVTPITSKGPEEVVPGQLMDTLDITVYERPNSGSSYIETNSYVGNGTNTRFKLVQKPFADNNVIAKVDYLIKRLNFDYEIDYATDEIVFNVAPENGSSVVITSSGLGGENILDYGEFSTDGLIQEYTTGVDYADDLTAYVTLNGKELAFELLENDNGKTVIKFVTPPEANRLAQWGIFTGDVETFSKVSIDTIIADGSSTAYELSRTPFAQQPTSYYTIVTATETTDDGTQERVLDAGYSEAFTVIEAVLEYKMKVWQIPVGTVEGVEIKVFLNDRELEFLQEWTYEGAASFNPNITPDAQEGSTIILNAGVANPGDELKVFILSSGEYRFGYFDSSTEFVDTSGKQVPALLTPTITDGVITAVEITNAGRGYTSESVVVASGLGEDAEFNITVDEVGSITGVNILNGGRDYTSATVLNIEIVPLPTVIYFDETFNEDTIIKVYQFTNHDGLGIEREKYDVVERTQMTVGTQGYNDFRQLKNSILELRKTALSVDFVWVNVNGKWLTPTADYILLEDKKTLKFITKLNDYDTVDIVHFAAPPISNKLGWRQFKDMLNETVYFRLSAQDEYELAEDLNWYDRSITVVGTGDNLPSPEPGSRNPGVLFIKGERIEYFRKEGNVLKQLRRGTAGTGIRDVYPQGTLFYNQSTDSIVPYNDNEERFTVQSGTYVNMQSLYPNDSIDITVTGITYSFNNNTAFPVRVPGVYDQVATITGTGFRPGVQVIMQDANGEARQLEKVSSTDTEIQFYTETMPVGAYDLVIYNPREEVPALRAATSLVLTKFLPYVQILLPYNPEAFTDVVQNPTETGEWYKKPFDELGIPDEYWQALNLEIFANGRRLRKAPIKLYDVTKGQFSPDGDIDIEAEYAVNKNEGGYVRLTTPPEPNTTLTIVRKLGNDWREIESTSPLVFKPLGISNTKVATFLRGRTINLPR